MSLQATMERMADGVARLGGTDGVPAGRRSPLLAALTLAALGLAGFSVANMIDSDAATVALAGLSAGVFGAGALALAAQALRRRAGQRWERAFSTLHGAAAEPAILTNFAGAIRAANAATRALPGGALAARVNDLIPGAAEAADARAYRLMREARREGVCRAEVFRDARTIYDAEIARVGPDRLLWTLRPRPRAGELKRQAAMFDAAPFGLVLFGDGGMAMNRTLDGMIEGGAASREALFEAPPRRSGEVVRLARPAQPGLAVRAFFDESGDGAPDAYVLAPLHDGGGELASAEELLERLPVPLARLGLDGRLISANAHARKLLGPGAQPGEQIGALVEGLGRSMTERVIEAARGLGSGRSEIARGRVEDREVFLQVSLSRLVIGGEPTLVAVLSDATELKTLEAQFVQSQKMQAVGQLAGGVAHDFNNLLTAINGHCDLLLMRHEAGDTDHADLTQIRQNANRAASLVRQMLAFSRKQTLRPRVLNLVDTLAELSHLLNRLLGEKVQLRLEHEGEPWLVRVDERQFEQVIMNLVVNARDAMSGGGEVRIRTRNLQLDKELCRDRAAVPPGDYALVEVMDSGVGIPPDKIAHIFDPFFTTKKVGEGTGLGLSTAYGIIKQTGGFIFADSEEGRGATFSIYLPRHQAAEQDEARDERAPAPSASDLTGEEMVLLVEDEAPVRSFASRALKMRGYRVLEADSAESALEILEDPELVVDVIVSDVVMPGMDGPTWVRDARQTRPAVKVIFVSGYAEDAFRKSLQGMDDFLFLPKPYTLNELTQAIREAVGDGAMARVEA